MSAELMLYAIIAAGLVFWLYNILGTDSKNGRGDRPVPNLELNAEGKIINLDDNSKQKLDNNSNLINELAENPKGNMSISSSDVQNKLIELAKIDKNFDVYAFLQSTQDVFVYVIESFAEGDRETLKNLLSTEIYNIFDRAITKRSEREETMLNEIQSIEKAEIIDARIDGKNAIITIRFYAHELSVTKDIDGNIIEGHPEKLISMRDIWTFSKSIKSNDPRWLVIETKDDREDDKDLTK